MLLCCIEREVKSRKELGTMQESLDANVQMFEGVIKNMTTDKGTVFPPYYLPSNLICTHMVTSYVGIYHTSDEICCNPFNLVLFDGD